MERQRRDSLLLADLAGDAAMMGVQAMSAQLFYDFCLDDHVPSSHMLRSIDLHLNLDDVRQALKPFYSSTGRPSIDPELRMVGSVGTFSKTLNRTRISDGDSARSFGTKVAIDAGPTSSKLTH